MKKFLVTILSLTMALAMTACGSEPNPDDFANAFAESIKTYDLESFSNYINKDVTDWLDNFDESEQEVMLASVDSTTYEITSVTKDEENVKYEITFEYDSYDGVFDKAWEYYMDALFDVDISDLLSDDYEAPSEEENNQKYAEATARAIAEFEPKRTTSVVDLTITYGDNGWEMVEYEGANTVLTKGLSFI